MAYTHIDLRVYTVSLPAYPVKSRKSAEKPGKFCTNFTYETDRRFWYLTLTRLHGKLYRQIFTPRGVAQLVARLLWEQDAAGSSPVTSTIIKRYSVYLSAVFYCLHDLSPGLEPVFNRAASRSRTQRVRASSPVTSTSSLWTSYRSQRLFQSHFSLTLSQLLFQRDPLRWARTGFLNGTQSICMPFLLPARSFIRPRTYFQSRREVNPTCRAVHSNV